MIDFEERDLREALRPLRPEPEAFRRAIERKLAERGSDSEPEVTAANWRAAAGLLPLGVFGSGSNGSLISLGQLPAVKGLSAVLSLPLVALAMVAWTCVAGLRALAGLRASASATRQAAEQSAREWWGEHLLHAGAALALLLVLAWTQPVEAVLFVLLVSMLALVGVLLRLSRAGAVSRESVGTLTANLLGGLAAMAVLAGTIRSPVDTPAWADPWVPWTVFWGSLACGLIGSWSGTWSPVKKLWAVALPLLLIGWSGPRMNAGLRSIDRARLVNYVESFDAPIHDVIEWRRLGEVAAWLRSSGPEELEAPSARAEIERVLAELEPGESLLNAAVPTHSLLGAARAGLLPESVWELIRSEESYANLLAVDGRLLESATTEWVLRAAARTPLDATGRDHLAARLAAAWPEPEVARSLEALAFYDQMSALIERGPLEATGSAQVHRALISHWAGSTASDGSAAAFVTHPERLDLREADLMRLEPTRAAVRLMRRHGVPAAVNLDSVEAYLRRAATPSLIEVLGPQWIDDLTVQSYRYVAEVALNELQDLRSERSLELPPVGMLQRVTDLRLLLGALALVVLCLFANVRVVLLERGRT